MRLPICDLICCWRKLLYGQACCVYNCVFAPIILPLWACRIYVYPCLWVYLNRLFYKVCCLFCRTFNCCWKYNDRDFPPNERSLGKLDEKTRKEFEFAAKSMDDVVWLRADQFAIDGKMQLCKDEIDPNDICQGCMGDCWLLAAIACLAEHKGAIDAVIRTKEVNPRGKYRFRLYDGVKGKWKNITIDDYIPCSKSIWEREGHCHPIFTRPNGNELWVMLLEKAFAKFCGSYSNLNGGITVWGIRTMTGDPGRIFVRSDDKKTWTRYDFANDKDATGPQACHLEAAPEGVDTKFDSDTMFEVLLKYDSLGCVLCTSGSKGTDGLVAQNHAYSILKVRRVNSGPMGIGGDTFRLIRCRNPWGKYEWKGAWSDNSAEWTKYPRVKDILGQKEADDGAFWMSWEDFVENWDNIGVVDRTVDINTLRFHTKDDSHCAPVIGCLKGCFRFWCCCQGPKRLYCPHRSSKETVKVGKKLCCCPV